MHRCQAAAIVALLLAVSLVHADNWPQWRGPTGQGYADDARVPLTWSEKENVLWKAKLPGTGNSSPIVWGDRVFLTAASADGRERTVLCLRTTDGKLLWQETAAKDDRPEKKHGWNTYASPSCTTDGQHVYAFFGTPGLFCYDFDGKLVWKQTFGVFTNANGWGIGASPFLFEDLVIQNCDNDGAAGLGPKEKGLTAAPMALVALDKATGKGAGGPTANMGHGFSTPILRTGTSGRKELLLNGPRGVWAYDPRSGTELWHCERPPQDDQSKFGEPLPVFSGDLIFALPGRTGTFSVLPSQRQRRCDARMSSGRRAARAAATWPRRILWDNLIYAADRNGLLTCLDFKSGTTAFKEKLRGSVIETSSPVAVRDRLLFVLETGETVVLQPGREFKVAGRNSLSDGTEFRASPAIADGRIFLRSQSHLYCIGEK